MSKTTDIDEEKQGSTSSTSCAPSGAAFADLATAVCVIDADDRIVSVNDACATLLDIPLQNFAGRTVTEIVSNDDAASLSSLIEQVRTDVANKVSRDIRCLRSDQPVWMTVLISHLAEGQGALVLELHSIDAMMRRIAALEKNETRWKFALESAHQGVWDHDFKADDLFYSNTWRELRGLPPDAPVDGSLEEWIENVHPDDRTRVIEHIRQQDEGEVAFNTFQYRERHTDGRWVWIESRGASIEWAPDGKPTRIIGTDTDVSDRKRAEARLEEVSRRLRLALDVSKIGVFEANLDTGTVERDKQLMRIYGVNDDNADQTEVFGQRLHPDDLEGALRRIEKGTASGKAFANAFRIIRPDGKTRHIRSRSVTFIDSEGSRKLIGANWDVTEDVALQEELKHAKLLAEARAAELEATRVRIEYNALHDHLTSLPNRRYLDQKLEDWIGGAIAFSAILHIDLDRFKQINDTLGHQAGDVMLVHTAETLRELTGPGDFVARIGGDEFVILCGAALSEADVIAMADRIIASLRQPVPYEGHLCRFGASAGIAWTRLGEDAKQSLMNADIALYRAKGQGRNRYEFFTKQLQTQIHHAKRTADEIIHGLEAGEFIPYYQPQFDARTFEITGVETLARWMHPRHGLLAPDYFLKVAEDINALTGIDGSIAEQALDDFRNWQTLGLDIPRFSVNVSSRRLQEPDLIESLRALDIPHGKLSFELLESIFLDDLDESTSEVIEALRALGIDIEIDDFGTGHASIVGLLKLSPSTLKIDRALIKPLIQVPEQRRLVGSIIDIGHSLNIDVVAEGVETLEHALVLRDLGCDKLQGYAFGKPMPDEELRRFVLSRSWPQADMAHRRARRSK